MIFLQINDYVDFHTRVYRKIDEAKERLIDICCLSFNVMNMLKPLKKDDLHR